MGQLLSFWTEVVDQLRLNWPALLHGYWLTILISALSMALALIVGAVMALLRTSEFRPMRWLSGAYVEVFRNTPLLVQLYFWFFALPRLPHFDLPGVGTVNWLLSPFQAGVLGLTVYTGAYTTEALRSGLQTVDAGQTEAARALGLTYMQTRVYVVAPQALRIAVPLLTNILSALFRNSAIVSVIGVIELLAAADRIQQRNFQTFVLFTVAGVLYLSITLPLAWASARLERRVARAR